MSLINKKHVKQYALEVSASYRSNKFTRVSNEFLIYIETRVREEINRYIKQLPSVGKTIKALAFFTLMSGLAHADTASWYSFESCRREGTSGHFTASKERFDENAMTCALPHRRFGGLYKVTNLSNGKAVIVRHNDLGPSKRLVKKGRVVDLSKGAFSKIADLDKGIVRVKVEAVS